MKSKTKLTFLPLSLEGQEAEFSKHELKEKIGLVCKPCWELKYCPYGPLVESFPLPSIPRHEAIEHNEYLKKCLKDGVMGDGEALDDSRRKWFEKQVKDFNERDYPVKITNEIVEMSCSEFGHLCPVFFSAEPFTETKEGRQPSRRRASRSMSTRVIRRDNSICQECSSSLKDEDIEIDHIIPSSKGGPTVEGNLRVLCSRCNKTKSNNPDDILDERSKLSSRKKYHNKDK